MVKKIVLGLIVVGLMGNWLRAAETEKPVLTAWRPRKAMIAAVMPPSPPRSPEPSDIASPSKVTDASLSASPQPVCALAREFPELCVETLVVPSAVVALSNKETVFTAEQRRIACALNVQYRYFLADEFECSKKFLDALVLACTVFKEDFIEQYSRFLDGDGRYWFLHELGGFCAQQLLELNENEKDFSHLLTVYRHQINACSSCSDLDATKLQESVSRFNAVRAQALAIYGCF